MPAQKVQPRSSVAEIVQGEASKPLTTPTRTPASQRTSGFFESLQNGQPAKPHVSTPAPVFTAPAPASLKEAKEDSHYQADLAVAKVELEKGNSFLV